jgi:hypothetical protein
MSLFYQLQGFNPEESQRMAERLAEQPDKMDYPKRSFGSGE